MAVLISAPCNGNPVHPPRLDRRECHEVFQECSHVAHSADPTLSRLKYGKVVSPIGQVAVGGHPIARRGINAPAVDLDGAEIHFDSLRSACIPGVAEAL